MFSALPKHPLLTTQGTIAHTEIAPAYPRMFAMFDATERPQYIGFSKDLRVTLGRMLVRNPSRSYYYSQLIVPPPTSPVEEGALLALRSAWYAEYPNIDFGPGTPWEEPVDDTILKQVLMSYLRPDEGTGTDDTITVTSSLKDDRFFFRRVSAVGIVTCYAATITWDAGVATLSHLNK